MSTLRNKDIIYAVMRHDQHDQNSSVCCFTKTYEYAEDLVQQYSQDFVDRRIDKSAYHFYVVGNVFYNE